MKKYTTWNNNPIETEVTLSIPDKADLKQVITTGAVFHTNKRIPHWETSS